MNIATQLGDHAVADDFQQDIAAFFFNGLRGNLWPYLYGTPQAADDPVRGARDYDLCLQEEPAYYLSSCEAQLFADEAPALAAHLGSGATIFELGPGAEMYFRKKTLRLLRACADLRGYVGVDISVTFLDRVLEVVRGEFPGLRVAGLLQDFSRLSTLPFVDNPVVLFKGSTIANLRRDEMPDFVRSVHDAVGRPHRFVVVHDANQDRETLMAAYDNAHCKRFYEGFPHRIQRDTNIAGFDPTAFRYTPEWVPEVHDFRQILTATRAQTCQLDGRPLAIASGQKLHIMSSFKYPLDVFTGLIGAAGYEHEAVYFDATQRMAAHVFRSSHEAARGRGIRLEARPGA
ncbi:MAG: L-histidine N(alpha)-methyltransferase [Pseudomonadota bacterium]